MYYRWLLHYSATVSGEESSGKVDLRLYNKLLSSVPPESTTIPLMVHCMLEQVYSVCDLYPARSVITHSLTDTLHYNLG